MRMEQGVEVDYATPDAAISVDICRCDAVDEPVKSRDLTVLAEKVRRNCRLERSLAQAREILFREHTPPPTIREISRRVATSDTNLKVGFKAIYGQSVSEFARELRMRRAQELIKTTSFTIGHISADLGYENQNSFTIAFKKYFGVLPRDYRRDGCCYSSVRVMLGHVGVDAEVTAEGSVAWTRAASPSLEQGQ